MTTDFIRFIHQWLEASFDTFEFIGAKIVGHASSEKLGYLKALLLIRVENSVLLNIHFIVGVDLPRVAVARPIRVAFDSFFVIIVLFTLFTLNALCDPSCRPTWSHLV